MVSLAYEPCFNYVDIDGLKKCAIKCSAHYYGKFNFSRKEAINFNKM